MTTGRKVRPLSVFCGSNVHSYCLAGAIEFCRCNCHYELEKLQDDLYGFAYSLWQVRSAFLTEWEDEADRRVRLESVISACRSSLDLGETTVEILAEALWPTINRHYWSQRETGEELSAVGLPHP